MGGWRRRRRKEGEEKQPSRRKTSLLSSLHITPPGMPCLISSCICLSLSSVVPSISLFIVYYIPSPSEREEKRRNQLQQQHFSDTLQAALHCTRLPVSTFHLRQLENGLCFVNPSNHFTHSVSWIFHGICFLFQGRQNFLGRQEKGEGHEKWAWAGRQGRNRRPIPSLLLHAPTCHQGWEKRLCPLPFLFSAFSFLRLDRRRGHFCITSYLFLSEMRKPFSRMILFSLFCAFCHTSHPPACTHLLPALHHFYLQGPHSPLLSISNICSSCLLSPTCHLPKDRT